MIPETEIRVLLRTLRYLDVHTAEEERAADVVTAWLAAPHAQWVPVEDDTPVELESSNGEILSGRVGKHTIEATKDGVARWIELPDDFAVCRREP